MDYCRRIVVTIQRRADRESVLYDNLNVDIYANSYFYERKRNEEIQCRVNRGSFWLLKVVACILNV